MPRRIDETIPKRCTHCGIIKSPDEFSRGSERSDGTFGLQGYCKKCHVIRTGKYNKLHPEEYRKRSRRYYYKRDVIRRKTDRKYRIQRQLYRGRKEARDCNFMACNASPEEILAAFTGKCFVCGVPEIECKTRLQIDHNHETGDFRGWLCGNCNKAAGLLRESPELILKLAKYVEQGGLICYG